MRKSGLAISVVVLLAPPVSAQHSGVLEEVVVTAQRREQSLQDVPVSVTAFTGADLIQGNIKSATDFLALTPNVSFTEDGQSGSRGLGIAVRGINNLVTGENAFINSVGIYLDEFSVASVPNQVANPFLPDMQRVEVLRGPQGTYFGRNSLGGALNITTNVPTDQFEGSVTVGGESYESAGEQFNVTAVLNVPINERLKARGSIYYEDSSGLVENINPSGADDSGHEWLQARLKVLWEATDQTTVNLTAIFSDEEQGTDENVPSGVWDIDTVDTFALGVPGSLLSPIDPGTGFWPDNRNKLSHDIDEHNKTQGYVGILNIAHQFNDDVLFKWVTGVIDATQGRVFDNDLVGGLDLIYRANRYDGLSWSTEGRIEITKPQYDLVAGILYAQDEQTQRNKVQISSDPTAGYVGPECDGDGDGIPGNSAVPCGFLPPFPMGLGLAFNNKSFEVESIAAFGDLTWHWNERLDLIIGGRYTHDKVTNEIASLGIAPNNPPAPPPSAAFFQSFINVARPVARNEEQFDDISPRFAARYQLTEEVGVYFTVSKGYKAGGTSVGNNTNAPGQPAVEVPFKDETLWNYEGGIKSELFERRLRLNMSVFHLEWSDLQLEAFRFLTPGDLSSNFEQVINVEDAEATGFEMEFVAVPTDRITITGGFGYLDSEITSDDTAELTGGIVASLKGLDIPKAPELTANLTGEYRFPLAANEAWIRLEYIHRDGQFSDIEALTWKQHRGVVTQGGGFIPATGSFPFETPDYDLLNLRLGYDMQNLFFMFYVQNLTDKEYYTGTQENFGISGIRLRPHPRFIGGSVSYRF